jgi:hypothetical protein
MQHTRSFQIQRGSVNEESGEFKAVLFTDGEASDGHVLNIAGAVIPVQMPLFVNHVADPRTQLGSLAPARIGEHEVIVKGRIFTGGEGGEAEVRRDLLAKMAAGHVSRMSGRWDADPEDVTRRTELPKEHPAYVSKDVKGPKRYGLYFDKWRAMEGSVVGLGADPAAMLRLIESAPDARVADFWSRQAVALGDDWEVLEEKETDLQDAPLDLSKHLDDKLLKVIGKALADSPHLPVSDSFALRLM